MKIQAILETEIHYDENPRKPYGDTFEQFHAFDEEVTVNRNMQLKGDGTVKFDWYTYYIEEGDLPSELESKFPQDVKMVARKLLYEIMLPNFMSMADNFSKKSSTILFCSSWQSPGKQPVMFEMLNLVRNDPQFATPAWSIGKDSISMGLRLSYWAGRANQA